MAKKVVKTKTPILLVGKCCNLVRQSPRGFTLIEVLIVIVIMSVLTGLVVFVVGNKPQKNQLEREALRLQSLVRWTLDEALFQNDEWGIDVKEDRYTFYRLNKKRQWEKVDDIEGADKTELKGLFEHELPTYSWMHVEIEGTDQWRVDADASDENKGDSAISAEGSHPGLSNDNLKKTSLTPPPILLLSSGEYTPFVIDFGLSGQTEPLFSVYGDGLSDVKMISGDELEKIHR